MVVDHIGYLCKDINKSIKSFETIGYKRVTEVINDNQASGESKPRNIYICFMKNNDTCIELVAPNGTEPSAVSQRLQKQGEGPYHICYRVNDMTSAIQLLKEEGWLIVVEPTPAIAFQNSPVTFLFKNTVGLIELVEIFEEDNV